MPSALDDCPVEPLPPLLYRPYASQYSASQPQGSAKRFSSKYPKAPFAWQWFWAFPAERHCYDPRLKVKVRYHLLPECIQRAVQAAARKVDLDGLVTPHVLRHAYATHSREAIDALSKLLGHSSIETTAGYRHSVVDRASNPLDDLLA